MTLSRYAYLILTFIVILAFSLRVYNLDKHGIFFDEKASVLISQGMAMEGNSQKNCFHTEGKNTFTPKEFWAEKNLDDYYDSIRRSDIGNSPFYYVVLHNWINMFGLSDFSARFLSVLFSCATILLLFFFIKEHFNNVPLALLASFLMAIEPFFIAYSQQIRNYSLSFFLTLLATHIFLKIIKNEEKGVKNNGLYLFYGILSAMCLLSHFLTATVFMAHGLYVLLFVRKMRAWVLLPLSLSIGATVFGYWITFGGGNYTFQTLSYQAKIYYKEAHAVPNLHVGYIDPATVENVSKKSLPIFTDLFISSNGLTSTIAGKKSLLLAFIISIFSIFALLKYRENKNLKWLQGILALYVLAVIFAFKEQSISYLEVINCGLLFYLLTEYWRNTKGEIERKQNWFLLILTFLPTLFLIFFTFKNGHTFGLTQRYSGFSFPYSIILVSLALIQAGVKSKPMNYAIWVVFVIHLFSLTQTIQQVLNDESLKYNYRNKARGENPYPKVAESLIRMYETGDTIVYPSYSKEVYKSDVYTKNITKSVADAQYVNLYLPKDAEFVQMVDAHERDKVYLKKKDGKKIEIFDFKGDTFRY
ncbi:glycosyltransferase family 39 protein [Arcicella sp. LKC2W]|uniref:glycosyltransferase family 39 protein n=1 Tax=Arcicella sp. LKC2W TaxID=2984198 RepID=UPI002B1E9D9F|nr:glycosyltransferase family 39 protein [Arcicella sp. LKC2W]MEA5461754.1 glycosyltransferase family 39 protein [Arcicella sp. LKC2W]